MSDSSLRILELGNSTRGFADRREPFTGDSDLGQADVVVMHFAELGNLFAQLVGQDKEAAWPRVQAGMKRLEDYLEGGGTLIAVPVATSSAYYGAQPYVKELIGWAQRIIGAEPKHKTGQQVIAGEDPAYRAFFEKMGAALYHTMYLDNPEGTVGLMVPEGHECLATHRWVGDNGLVLALPEVKNPEKRREYIDAAVALTQTLRTETGRPAAAAAAPAPAAEEEVEAEAEAAAGADLSGPSDRAGAAIGPLERLLNSVRAASRSSQHDNDDEVDEDEAEDDLGSAPAVDEPADEAAEAAANLAESKAAEIAADEAEVEAAVSPAAPAADAPEADVAAVEEEEEEEEPLELTEEVTAAPPAPPVEDEVAEPEPEVEAAEEPAPELAEAEEAEAEAAEAEEPEAEAAEAEAPVEAAPAPPAAEPPPPPPANDDRVAAMTTVERSATVAPLKQGPQRGAGEDWSDHFLLPADAEIAQSIMAIEEKIATLQAEQKRLRQQLIAGKHRKALIAARGDGFIAAAREAFEELGYKVERAGNGDSAFMLAHASAPDRRLLAYCSGSAGAIVDRDVIARLLHLEASYFATHGELPKMLAVLNAHAGRPLDGRDMSPAAQFGEGLARLGAQRGWCVMSGLQLMGMALAGEESPQRREALAGQIADGSGPLKAFDDWTEFLVKT